MKKIFVIVALVSVAFSHAGNAFDLDGMINNGAVSKTCKVVDYKPDSGFCKCEVKETVNGQTTTSYPSVRSKNTKADCEDYCNKLCGKFTR